MATKLEIYNRALAHLGERKIASLTENREPRRVLDDHWESNADYCLEAAMWNFAIRAVEVESSASVTPTFGYTYAFEKPSDWIRTAMLSASDKFEPPLMEYRDEAGFWWADVDPLYVTFVSDDTSYGADLSLWPESYAEYVAVRLARVACKRIVSSGEALVDLRREERQCKATAVSKDAMNEAAKFRPQGLWVASRLAGSPYNGQRYRRA